MKLSDRLTAYAKEYRGVFLMGALFAAIVHLYFFTNTLPNYDTLVTQYSYNMGLSLGRWTNSLGSILSSAYALPWVTGVICFAFLGLLCVVLCDVLEVRTKAGRAAVCALAVSFPTLAASYSFLFIADSLTIGIFLAALSVKLVKDTRFGFLTGGALLGVSIGFYQSHISYAMLLCVIVYALQLLGRRFTSAKEALRQAGRYALLIVTGFTLYYIGFRLCLLVTGYQLPDSYQDIQALTGGFSFDPGASLARVFAECTACIGGGIPFLSALRVPLLLLTALSALICGLTLAVRNRVYKDPLSCVLLVLLLLAVPVSLAATSFISTNVGYHAVMRTPWMLLFVGAVAVAERAFAPLPPSADAPSSPSKPPKGRRCLRAATLAVAFLTAWNFLLVSNMGYLNMQQRYERDYAVMIRVADRLEQTEGFTGAEPLLCTGYYSAYAPVNLFARDQAALDALAGMNAETMLVYPHVYNEFLRYYLGVNLPYPCDATVSDILASDAYAAMGEFPAASSVGQIDGVFVVKLSGVG